ncbi:hypothetical protein GALMADRAFT_136469 [Galerina marginata CBS 339.88]|uniref:Rab-GAP TBC domain-containing protein n=1 Tax=Galerina marginata (strain CBS 339.88) TaxID=685588 RepID=A0A067T9L0_GALM3|nr:hypothetical protein GALMADRAFT_136469 [Galerina marginata CBS 339.88]
MPTNENYQTKLKPQPLDWDDLREKSLQKGGFGEARVDIWPKLLHVSRAKDDIPSKIFLVDEEPPHQDERQIGLDTDRSFVLYPVEPKYDRETLQAALHKLLVSLFRKRPRLSYFQGYHDIVTVLFLTLPPELQLLCVEKVSLHRLRDSMGSGLEPVLGLLRVTKNLIRLVDPDFAQVLERNSPLPFYALSNLLTLFAHDMPTLPLIQHVFDYLLCRPPIASVYLAAAIILSRKKEVIRLEEEDEDGMIHSLLSSFPNLVDDVQNDDAVEAEVSSWKIEESQDGRDDDNTFFKEEADEINTLSSSSAAEEPAATEDNLDLILDGATGVPEVGEQSPILIDDVREEISKTNGTNVVSAGTEFVTASSNSSEQPLNDDVDLVSRPSASSRSSELPAPEATLPIMTPSESEQEVHLQSLSPPPPISSEPKPASTNIFLTELLRHADALYKEYPPSHSGLALSTIMGPQSVVFTWSESPAGLPSDTTAEAMVSHPELVVYPYLDIDLDRKDTSLGKDKEGKEVGKEQRRLRKLRKSPFGKMERKTMLAGTVLVLGVAMAVYGIRARNNNSNGYGFLFGIPPGRLHPSNSKDWKRLGGWVGGALAGMSEKIMNGLTSGS